MTPRGPVSPPPATAGGPLWPVHVAILGAGLMMGAAMPLVPLALEARGIDNTTIGLNGAMWAVGLLAAGPFIPRWAARLGTLPLLWLALLANALLTLGYVWTDDLPTWFALRFAQGAATGVPWMLTEIWINLVTEERRRGRALALYSTLMAAGLAAGPLLLQFTGTRGATPFLACAALSIAVAVPLVGAIGRAPAIRPERGGGGALGAVALAPLAMVAALVAGLAETVVFTFLSIYAVGAGVAEATATLWQSAFLVGNLALQLPIGWLADRLDRAMLIAVCALACALAAAALPLAGTAPLLVVPLLAVWGGLSFGLYTVGLTILGERFAAGDMARANAAFVMVYTFGSLVGPPASGKAMDAFGGAGLGLSLAAAYAVCAVVAAFATRRPADKGGPIR
ncbi:MAG: MFS transporter [Rhodospirillales bacterium]|nr:MAG: MFS transporter [Rhodospirillales bacterium]